jgi:hypothetical protein
LQAGNLLYSPLEIFYDLMHNLLNKYYKELIVPCGRKRKRHKIATHKRKKKLRKNRHKKK